MTAPNLLSKAFCYQDLRRIYAICLPPWAWLDKNTPGEIGLNLITYANVCIIRIDTCWFYVKVFWEYTKTNKNFMSIYEEGYLSMAPGNTLQDYKARIWEAISGREMLFKISWSGSAETCNFYSTHRVTILHAWSLTTLFHHS